ncbi:type 1 glutamine amidotransferase [candidate division KSB1 bacterium]|nr:type 1 glutamine amidotransferase [candidate division KSB1 bacterium]
MADSLRFLILDGYPEPSRRQFDEVGMTLAGQLYADLLLKHLPNACCDIHYTSDPDYSLPTDVDAYDGILWPGCNLTVYHSHDERVSRMIRIAEMGYESGVPQFGSCWAAQLAVYVAGGTVEPNPKGREMGVARKVHLTEAGRIHPMYTGKPWVFDGFISHDDHITVLPPGAQHLAGNSFTQIQAVSVVYKKGEFWATQYHPEYNLLEVARLIVAREEKLTREGYFRAHEDMLTMVNDFQLLAADPSRKDLKWKYAIDEDLLDDGIREIEFVNWLYKLVIPLAQAKSELMAKSGGTG